MTNSVDPDQTLHYAVSDQGVCKGLSLPILLGLLQCAVYVSFFLHKRSLTSILNFVVSLLCFFPFLSGLSRIPMLNSFARTPPIVWKIGWVPTPTGELATKLPPLPIDLMHDKEVLKEYIFRINSIGKFVVKVSCLYFSARIVLYMYCNHIMGNGYTLKGGNCQNWFYLSCEKGFSLKGKNLLPLGANSFLLE